MNYKPFNLELALSGAKVVTRDGRTVSELHLFETLGETFPLVGIMNGEILRFKKDGTFMPPYQMDERDLFMAPIESTVFILIVKSGVGLTAHGPYDTMLQLNVNRPYFTKGNPYTTHEITITD
jgi:hypothetical protein